PATATPPATAAEGINRPQAEYRPALPPGVNDIDTTSDAAVQSFPGWAMEDRTADSSKLPARPIKRPHAVAPPPKPTGDSLDGLLERRQ
ncbi:MAG TPA: hypothetical protein VGL13_17675, partial [Polyangiaceae bacterium]